MFRVNQIIWDSLTLPCPKAQRHISEELNHENNCCDYLRCCMRKEKHPELPWILGRGAT
jgi:hypothetical protein